MLRTATLLLALLCVSSSARAERPLLELGQLAGGVSIFEEIGMLQDPSGTLRYEDVSHPPYSVELRGMPPESTFGFNKPAVWLHFVAHNGTAQTVSWMLEMGYPHIDHVDLYVRHADGTVTHTQTGDTVPFAQRPVDVPTFVFPQQAAPGETVHYWMRARSKGVSRLPLRAFTPAEFVGREVRQDLVLWLFYGAVLIMACFNLGVGAMLRRREYFYHVGLLLSVGGAISALSGHFYQFVVPTHPTLGNRAMNFLVITGLLFVQLYAREVLGSHEQGAEIKRLFRYTLPPACVALGFTMFTPWGLWTIFYALGAYIPIGIYKLWKVRALGVSSLRLHLPSLLCLAVSIPIAMLAHSKVIPPWPIALWAAHLGCAAFALLTALDLPKRLNVMADHLAGLNGQLSQNVVELKEALGRAEHANDEAKRATKVKDEFMATMSHELRTPLNAIINVPQGLLDDFQTVRSATCKACSEVYVLERDERLEHQNYCDNCHGRGTLHEGTLIQYVGDPAHTARFLRKIERSGQHLLQMVNGVLDFSKMEAGRVELALEPLDVRGLLGDVVDGMSELAAQRNLSIEVQLADSREPGLGDALRLRQVLLNLLSNAIKFSEPGGKITISWSRDAEADLVTVKDQGIGIARENHERVFASFEQVHKGDTRKYGGTGLGLSISRSLVRMHGGELWVESALGAGATFKFTIPRRIGSAPHTSSAA